MLARWLGHVGGYVSNGGRRCNRVRTECYFPSHAVPITCRDRRSGP